MINKVNKYILAGLLTGLLSAVAYSGSAHAVTTNDTTENITLSPAIQRFNLEPGTTVRDKFEVRNDSETEYDFIVYGRPYSVSNNDYDPNFDAQPPNADVYKWVQFDKINYRIKPHETVTVNYTIRVPKTASPGRHYGVLFAETQPNEQSSDSASVARKKRLGDLVMVTVKGEVKLAGESLGSSLEFWQWRPPVLATTSVKNTGNTDFPATVNMEVHDILGRRVYTKNDNYLVFPNTSRTISVQWAQAPWFGLFKVDMKTSYLDKQQDSLSGYVLIMPRWLTVVLVGALIAGAIYVILRRRR